MAKSKGIRENPPTLTIDVTWSPARKAYVATLSYHGGSGRYGVRRYITLRNENRLEITEEGAQLLLDALDREYGAWLF